MKCGPRPFLLIPVMFLAVFGLAVFGVFDVAVFDLVTPPCFAAENEEVEKEAQKVSCAVTVKAISGSARVASASGKALEAGKFLSDVKHQLEPLPFQRYRIVDSTERSVELGSRSEFNVFDDGARHTLFIKPCEVVGRRVQVRVDWTGPEGNTLLSTKLGVVNGKNVVVGTDTSGDTSTIMSIKIDCPS